MISSWYLSALSESINLILVPFEIVLSQVDVVKDWVLIVRMVIYLGGFRVLYQNPTLFSTNVSKCNHKCSSVRITKGKYFLMCVGCNSAILLHNISSAPCFFEILCKCYIQERCQKNSDWSNHDNILPILLHLYFLLEIQIEVH